MTDSDTNPNTSSGTGKLPEWLDCHVHLYPERMRRAVKKWFETNSDWELPYLEKDTGAIIEKLKEWGVEEIFSLHYAHKPDMSLRLNRWVKEFIEGIEEVTVHPFGAIHPEDDDLNRTITETLDEMNFPGFKIQCSVMGITADDPRLDPIAEALVERGKGLVIHTGTAPEEDGTGGIQYFRPLMKKHPNLKVLVPHLGMMEFEEFAALLPEHNNLYFDVSATLNPRFDFPWDSFKTYLDDFPDRFLFGTDLPLNETDPPELVRKLLERNWNSDVYERLFRENARQFLRA
jgi:predicted TIM-barrel fold metal-dependent hydrolase